MILWLYSEKGTMLSVILEAPKVDLVPKVLHRGISGGWLGPKPHQRQATANRADY